MLEDVLIPVVAIITIFIGFPGLVFAFIFSLHKKKMELRKLEYETRKLELEIEIQNNHIKLLEEEHKKYDRIINGA